MKLIIDGREYDGTAQPFIGDLRLLKKEFGFGYGTVMQRLRSMNEDTDMLAMMDDQDWLDAFIAWMWMSRLRSGERTCTRADAEMVALDQVQMVPDKDDDEGESADDAAPTSAPKASGRGSNGAAGAAAKRKPATTRTSS